MTFADFFYWMLGECLGMSLFPSGSQASIRQGDRRPFIPHRPGQK